MPKERNSKVQSRKKQVTDVSDALFHVTPQPSIDIFEVLGGAINVQTAAFLTGKTDQMVQSPQEKQVTMHADATTLTETVNAVAEAQPSLTEEVAQATAPKPEPVEPLAEEKPSVEVAIPQGKLESSMPLHDELSSPAPRLQDLAISSNKGLHSPDLTGMSEVAEAFAPIAHEHSPHFSVESVPAHTPPVSSPDRSTLDSDNANKGAISHDITPNTDHAKNTSPTISTAISTHGDDQKNSAQSSSVMQQSASTAHSVHHSRPSSMANTQAKSIENSTGYSTSYTNGNIKESSTANSIATQPLPQGMHTDQNPLYANQNTYAPAQSLLQQLTKREEELLQFLRQHNGQIVSYSQMLKSLNWRESQRCTARNIVARFEANGIIVRQRIHGTRSQGYLFTLCEQNLSMGMAHTANTMQSMPMQAHHMAMPHGGYSNGNSMVNSIPVQHVPYGNASMVNSMAVSSQEQERTSMEPSTPSYIDKIDRLIQSIWQSDRETIMACWPAAGAAGLSSAHLRQLQSIFTLQGFEDSTVSLSLRYLDWQLEQGPLTNARGELIEDPIAYWLSSMRRHGYYGRPKGYVDPLVEAKRLLAEEEQAKLEAQTKLDQARQQLEAVAEEERSQALFQELMQEGEMHVQWSAFYQSLPRVLKQKVDANGPSALAKSFAMVRALVKELL